MEKIKMYIKRKDSSEGLNLPCYMSSQAAGMDLAADIDDVLVIGSGKFRLVPTGVFIALPQGYEAQIRPRSGLAYKHGVTILNSPGTIDADYRGEICVLMINLGEKDFEIRRGDRIAQMVINKIEQVELVETDVLPGTERGAGGFGSTGV